MSLAARSNTRDGAGPQRTLSLFYSQALAMKSILIIDGSKITASSLLDFEKRGWLVVTCDDTDSAMQRLAGSEPCDVVLFGSQVRETDAVKLIRFIRALDHRRTTGIVMLTENCEDRAGSGSRRRRSFRQAG